MRAAVLLSCALAVGVSTAHIAAAAKLGQAEGQIPPLTWSADGHECTAAIATQVNFTQRMPRW